VSSAVIVYNQIFTGVYYLVKIDVLREKVIYRIILHYQSL